MNRFVWKLVVTVLVVPLLLTGAAKTAFAAELVMFESDSCEWCEIWNKQIGLVYAKTSEGKFAPLRRVDISDDLPADLKKLKSARFTPTFVVIDQGREVGRILGYPGEAHFWALLEELVGKLPR